MRDELGVDEAEMLAEALRGIPSVSIRINAAKCRQETRISLTERSKGPVEWCADGLRFESRPDFISDPLMHAGVYYVQEAGSMYYQTVMENLLTDGEITEPGMPLRVLDMCAAPGGKTTAMLNALYKSGIQYEVVANEYDRKRSSILVENIQKWGDPHVTVTNSDAKSLGRLEDVFDIIAVDAPCSGEGMMRREPVARTQWSPELVSRCSALQKDILKDILPALKPGGILIYSTCTFNREENEENTEYITKDFGLQPVGEPRRFMPHRNECEGLFVAVFRKPFGETSSEGSNKPLMRLLEKNKIRVVSVGITATERKGNLKVPSSKGVLASDYDRGLHPYIDLSPEEALDYLRGMPLVLPEGTPKGYVAVGYDGYPLGLVKNIGARANNLYPAEWRIRNR